MFPKEERQWGLEIWGKVFKEESKTLSSEQKIIQPL